MKFIDFSAEIPGDRFDRAADISTPSEIIILDSILEYPSFTVTSEIDIRKDVCSFYTHSY